MDYLLIYYSLEEHKKGQINIEEHSLKDITIFTSQFNCEKELKDYFIENKLLPIKYQHYNLGILSTKSNKLINYGITYKSDLKYLNTEDIKNNYDTSYIKEYFIKGLKDVVFMEYFIEEFYDYLINVPIFKESLKFLKYTYEQLKYNNYIEEAAVYYMNEFLKYYTTRRTKNGHKNNFTNIRYLAMFISNYEQNLHPDIIDEYKIMQEYEHYEYLLENSANTDEDQKAYQKKLDTLDKIRSRKRD